jgi:hypothetical protein
VLCHFVAAVVIGLLLPHVADLAEAVRTADGVVTSEVEVGKRFEDDGWLVVLGGLAGLGLGMGLQLWRRTHEVVTLVAIVASALSAALLAGWIAETTGPGDAMRVLAEAKVGATARVPVEIDSRVAYLVWPLAGALGALVTLVALPAREEGDTPADSRL